MSFEKTDTAKSPLLKPVVERDYTKGITIDSAPMPEPEPDKGQQPGPSASQAQPKPEDRKYNIPPASDETKEFSFNDPIEDPSDIGESDHLDGVNITGASAKSFANFVGDALQIYLPKAAYTYSKVDIENIIMNVEKGTLTYNWVDVFNNVNIRTEEALKISDEEIKMWKKAFKDWLESEQIRFANPKNELILATALLVGNLIARSVAAKKDNEKLVREALAKSNPAIFDQKNTKETVNEPAKTAA